MNNIEAKQLLLVVQVVLLVLVEDVGEHVAELIAREVLLHTLHLEYVLLLVEFHVDLE